MIRVHIVGQACAPGIPSEVKQDLFWEGSGTPLRPWSLVKVLLLLSEPSIQKTLKRLSFLNLKIRELNN